MTYDPQQQRPEEQTNNSNRETLNIQQPGENANTGFDWGAVRAAREAAGRQSKAPQANDPSVGLKDVLLSAAAAPTDIISANAQLFKDSAAKFGKLVAHNFMETMAFNPIPQVAMPIAEAYVNYDFFKGGPIENMADSNLMAGARYNDQTSLLMREVGEATNMSPKMLDHIVMGYTGSLGGYVMGATNLLMRNLKDYGETPAMRLDELPVIKSFFRGSDPAKSTQFTEDFYRMMTEANQINSTINSFRKQGRGDDANELIEDNRGKLSQRQGLTATQKQVKALNAQIEMMRRDRILTADQKREKIDRLMATRNKLVQQAVERVSPYFNK
ncbi:LPD38 domain-containing protein [Yersinia enterocolitica]|uniref:LPD38 domain-containing protein n=1 Tax=Yersinia enterocolitica TaxID=630 RepID=UPI001EFD3BA1|nr:LPD38 domain-containing protein [Yersinia enterocolitica]MCG9176867.1 hypothetical protein [Yersinia enterocolitica]